MIPVKDVADVLRRFAEEMYVAEGGRSVMLGDRYFSVDPTQFATLARLLAGEKVQGEDGAPLNPEAIKAFQGIYPLATK